MSLALYQNKLQGSLPTEWGTVGTQWIGLTILQLQTNALTGVQCWTRLGSASRCSSMLLFLRLSAQFQTSTPYFRVTMSFSLMVRHHC